MDRRTIRNDDALAAYLKSISSDLLRVAYSYIQDDAGVDEVIGETIYRVYKYRKKVKNPEYFKTWIIRILINECKTELKRRNSLMEYREDVEHHTDGGTEYGFVYEYINALTSPYREIVMLKTLNDYTFRVIAGIVDMKEPTVKAYYYKALDVLRKEMADLYE